MRTKKALYNNFAAVLLQMTILLFGLIMPRFMIQTYGSELNGLVTSTKQMISYLQYLELGITSALIYSLYKPMALNDYNKINPLITRAKKDYEKIGFIYFIGVILISLIYPIILSESIGYWMVFLVIFLVGIYGALDFYSLSKYRVLLEADQRAYVINIITTITTTLQNGLSILLLIFDQSLYLVILVPTLVLPLRSLLLKLYVKNKYQSINYDVKPSNIKFDSRIDAFISGLANSLNISLPVVVVSLIVSLEMASVYSIYSMVFMGLAGIINVFIAGMRAAFGNMHAKGEKEILIKSNDYYEFALYFLLSILYSATFSLIIPFVQVYTADIADINYVYPMIGALFTMWSVIHNSRIPNQTIINATGNWKICTKTNLIQMFILIISTFVLGFLFQIEGILIGMIVSSLFKTISLMNISNKKILNIGNKKSILRLLRIFIIIGLTNLPFIFRITTINTTNFLKWSFDAFIVLVWVTIISLAVNFIFDKETIINLFGRYIKKTFKGKL